MPFYDYRCDNCNDSFESFLPMSDIDKPTEQECKKCGGFFVRLVPAAPAIGDPVRLGITRAPSDFQKYVLGKIAAKHPKHKMDKTRSIKKEI